MSGRSLEGMVVVVTGASAGIGRALAEGLAHQGARLVLAARRMERLEELNRELGGGHLVVRADVSEPEDCRRLIESAVGHFGRIDTLVCNAGYGIYKPVADTTAEEMRGLLDTDVIGTTECIRWAVPQMARQEPVAGWRGQIMIVSSAAGRRGTPFIGAYSGAKAAQLAIAEALRVELAPSMIAVTSVHPTMTQTEFRQAAEALGTHKLPPSPAWVPVQSARHVAKKTIQAMRRPRAEVWPLAAARWFLGLGTLFPSLIDRGMARYRDAVLKHNAPGTGSDEQGARSE